MQVDVHAMETRCIDVKVDAKQVLEELGIKLKFRVPRNNHDGYYDLDDNGDLCYYEDDAYHGSSHYNIEVVSNDPEVIEAFKAYRIFYKYVEKINSMGGI